jgi:hypothetical protein
VKRFLFAFSLSFRSEENQREGNPLPLRFTQRDRAIPELKKYRVEKISPPIANE